MVLLSLLALAGASIVNAIPTISAKGSKFFTSDGDQFYVKGIAYQLVPDDPLIDANQCGLDAELMKTLGTNSIRVYHVDPNGNHDDCMKAFEDAGIYIWLDLDTFDTQVTQEKPQWTQAQYDAFAAVMDTFHSYDNLAGFFVGNEAITTANGSVTAPYIKAAARDMKKYRDDKKYRSIPIGYSAADIAQLRPNLQNYLACGQDTADSLDFFSLNAYSWCGTSSYQQSGYDILEKNSTDLHIPIFMSETGCNTVRPRDFQDQTALFGEMSDVWSGSIIYEWIEEANNYGLISYGPKVAVSPTSPPDGFPRSGKPIPVEPDFPNLSAVWASLKPSGVKEADYNPTNAPPVCPDYTAGAWEVVPTSALPTLGQQHNFGAEPTQGSGSGNGNGSSAADGSASGSAQPTGSAAAAPQSFGMGAGIVGMMAVLAWL